MLNALKDAVTSRAALALVNSRISRYGTVTGLAIDSRLKRAELTCLLHGESAPLTVTVETYAVEKTAEGKFIRIDALSCSRPWLQNLLADFATGRRFELPAWAAAAL